MLFLIKLGVITVIYINVMFLKRLFYRDNNEADKEHAHILNT